MTTEERLARIEHVTAGLDEERRKDREENRQIWRETQRQLTELSTRTLQMGDELRYAIDRFAVESRAADQRLGERIQELDQRLGQRIEQLVSSFSDFIARQTKPPQP